MALTTYPLPPITPSLSYLFGNSFCYTPQSLPPPKVALSSSVNKEMVVHEDVMNIFLAHNNMHKKMRKKEIVQHQKRTWRGRADAEYQQCRSTVVDWIIQVGEACHLCNLTVHSAIGFMDNVLDLFPVASDKLQLVAIACILIAAKIEEQEENIPRIRTLSYHCGHAYTRQFILKMESVLLNYLKWEVIIITPLNFLEYYLQVAFHPSELASNPHITTYEDTKSYLEHTAEFFVDLCQHYSFFREYLPSLVASAAIAASRQILKIQPVWSPSLCLLSSYSLDDISPCLANIWSFYSQTFPSYA
jgi:hypothetical protein